MNDRSYLSYLAAQAKRYGFTEPLSEEQESIIRVAILLTDKEIVFSQFEKLEKLLAERKKTLISSDKYVPFDTKNPAIYKNHKLLSTILYDWAKENGFGKPVKVSKVTGSNTILSLFANATLFKDKNFRGKVHGEWVHLLQWYVLSEANKKEHFLLVEPSNLLAWIGRQTNGDRIWDKTFEDDFHLDDDYEFDARSTERLNAFLLSEECKREFPVLHECIYARSLKPKDDPALIRAAFDKLDINAIQKLIAKGMEVNQLDVQGRSLLIMACEQQKVDVARILLKAGAKVNRRDTAERTPLLLACRNNDLPMATLLLENGAEVHDHKGHPFIVECLQQGYLQIAKRLLQHGTDVNWIAITRWPPCTLLEDAMNSKRYDIANFLIDNGAYATNEQKELLRKNSIAGDLVPKMAEEKSSEQVAVQSTPGKK